MPAKVILLAVGLGVGGTETHIVELASRLDRSRFTVTVCALKPNGTLVQELQKRGVRVLSLGGAGKLDARVIVRLFKLLRVEQPDVVQAFLFWANVAARACGRILRAFPVISSYHDEVVSEGWLVRLVDRLTLHWTQRIVCCSHAVSRSVVSRIGGTIEHCTMIPFGVDIEQFESAAAATRRELGLRDSGNVIGTVCRLVEPKKGLTILLRAMAELARRYGQPPCQLVIVGDGPSRDELEVLREQLGLSSWIVFTGSRRDIPRVLHALDAFVLPSLYEGFGIAILEAMAAGKPVIATTVGGIPDFVLSKETGLLVEPGNVQALADAIAHLLSDPQQAEAMGAKARVHARDNYRISEIVRQHEQVYSACLARGVDDRS
ncbi:MAG: glycosyltransferase [Nitrospira sp.]|nr:glycosyltransferase [Nitrospira sp.]MDH4302489.1 glycosyltransferase [Nitrospira sp.]MDH5192225.1 glycosyltransferase [Nitrospira sp.]